MEIHEYENRADDGVLKLVMKYRSPVKLMPTQLAAIKQVFGSTAQRVKAITNSEMKTKVAKRPEQKKEEPENGEN